MWPGLAPLFSRASALFHFAYAVSSLFATLTKTAGVWGYSSHSGTQARPLNVLIYVRSPHPACADPWWAKPRAKIPSVRPTVEPSNLPTFKRSPIAVTVTKKASPQPL
jgi:hypothetical protein